METTKHNCRLDLCVTSRIIIRLSYCKIYEFEMAVKSHYYGIKMLIKFHWHYRRCRTYVRVHAHNRIGDISSWASKKKKNEKQGDKIVFTIFIRIFNKIVWVQKWSVSIIYTHWAVLTCRYNVTSLLVCLFFLFLFVIIIIIALKLLNSLYVVIII